MNLGSRKSMCKKKKKSFFFISLTRLTKWKKTTLKGMWRNRTSKIVGNGIVETTNEVSVTIVEVENFAKPKEFVMWSNVEGMWTINAKNNKDMVVLGEVYEAVDTLEDIKYIRANYEYLGVVESVRDNTMVDGLKNVKVIGR